MQDKIKENKDIDIVVVEPSACPTLTGGGFRYDFGDSPIISQLYADGLMRAVAYHQTEIFDAAVTFARSEGIVPAPESAHAIKCAIDTALECKKALIPKSF